MQKVSIGVFAGGMINLQKHIRRAQATEKVILNSLLQKKNPAVADAENFIFSEVENLVFYNLNGTSRIWIPSDNEEVQNAVLWELHDNALCGHPGIEKTIRAVQEKFYWRSMVRRITQYIKFVRHVRELREELERDLASYVHSGYLPQGGNPLALIL
ncbi:unnamed protein product [Phytophthora fragariaefolia]|uniref:Unnamed protein product n=1 Tax=Phytophthora fragariaefolia TaxID=1490495 RepID=A0A9W6Y5F5_9STRA|nr:unnamed protein product [Phytophthora fragariaefolia]